MSQNFPDPLPAVPEMLAQLEQAYQQLVEQQPAAAEDAQRLHSVLHDLQWYAERLGAARWDHAPRAGRWSFAQNLWHIANQAVEAAHGVKPERLRYYVDHGKEHVGQAAELLAIFSYDEGIDL